MRPPAIDPIEPYRAERGRDVDRPVTSRAAGGCRAARFTRFLAAFFRAGFTARLFGFSGGGSGFPVNAS